MDGRPRVLFVATVVTLVSALHGRTIADFPEKPIKIIVPFNPGGESDTFTRIVQGVVESEGLLNQPLVVINVGGAGGTIGSRRAKDADPDGYTILNLHDGILSAKLTEQVEYGPDAFEPIAAMGRASSMVCVKSDARWKDLKQLLADASENPDTIRFGANLGALSHFGALQLEQTTDGAAFRYVPTGGGAKRFGDLLGDHIDVTVFNAGEYVHFKDGGIRALAILHSERHDSFPDVPTAREQGVNIVRNSMQYFWAPKETPPEKVAFFVDLFRRAMQSEAMQTKMAELKMDPVFLSGPELRHTLRQRELVMKGVRMDKTIELPNTPMLMIVVTFILGALVAMQRFAGMRANAGIDTQAAESATNDKPDSRKPNIGHAVLTLAALLVYCLLFGSGALPFWLISTVFVLLLGLVLLKRDRQMISWLVATAIVVGPGCYLLFTKVLSIDLP